MILKVLLSTEVLINEEVTKIVAEGENGSFCLLPRHIDFVTALVPGILVFEKPNGDEEFLAVDEGTLVKTGPEVFVSTRNASRGKELGALEKMVEAKFRTLDDRERTARSASARLEADLVRRFMELGRDGK